jgi:hypothetical protein
MAVFQRMRERITHGCASMARICSFGNGAGVVAAFSGPWTGNL